MMRKFLSLFLIIVSVLMVACLSASSLYAKSWNSGKAVIGHSPGAGAVTITGAPQAGSVLSGHYTFSDLDGDTESGSLLQWYASGDGGTTLTPLSGSEASSMSYTLQDADTGKQILFGITPKTDPAITDPYDNAEVRSVLTPVIVHATPNATLSTFTQDRATIAATGSDKAILTLTLKRNDGNPITGLASQLTLGHSATAGVDAVSLTTNDRGNGVYEFSVTGTQTGTVVFTPQLDGATFATTPPTLTLVLTGDSSTAQITSANLTVTSTVDAVADDSHTNQVQAIVTDAAGRPVSGVTVSFTTVLPAHITTSIGVTDIDGIATASLASTKAGPVAVTAKINSTGSTQSVNVNFIAGAATTANSTLGAGTASIIANNGGAGGTSLLTLTLKDSNNNPVTGQTVTFPVTGTAAAGITGITGGALTATESPANSGIYTATLSGITAGTATVSTTVGGSAFSATPATVSVTLTADASTAKVSQVTNTTGVALANNVDPQTVTATVKDANGNLVPNATVNFAVTTGIATLNSASAITNAIGVATVTVKDTTAETATVTAKVGANAADGGLVANATFSLYPVVSSISNTVPAVNNSPADGAMQNTLIVQVSDLAGNAIKNTATTLNFTGTDLKIGPATLKYGTTVLTAANTALAVTTDPNGRVTLTATDVTAETITVSAKVSTSTQAAQTQNSTFALYPVLSGLVAGANNSLADNTALNTVIATLTDKKGTVLVNQPVTLTFSKSSASASFSGSNITGVCATTPCAVSTDASGHITFSLKDSNAAGETVTVTAYAQGSAIDQRTANVVFASVPIITGVSVNGVTFAANAGFPTTGFKGATFQILINNGTALNGNYNWTTSQTGWTSVDASGNVRFSTTTDATSATKNVTISATPKAGGAALTYSISGMNKWFVNNGGTSVRWTYANTYCSTTVGGGYALPTRDGLLGGDWFANRGYRGIRGGLWAEWGDMGVYGMSGFNSFGYWTADPDPGVTGNYYEASLGTGFAYSDYYLNNYGVVCLRGL